MAVGIDCGMTHITDEIIREKLKGRAPEKGGEVGEMWFGAFGEYVASSFLFLFRCLSSLPISHERKERRGFFLEKRGGGGGGSGLQKRLTCTQYAAKR